MYLKLISCDVLARPAYYCAAFSPHTVDIELLQKGLHAKPENLRDELSARLAKIEPGQYDAILLGYGLCSNSVAGLGSPHTPIIIPRAHDCITLFLGSCEQYASEFRANPGTYWYTPDYLERGGAAGDVVALGATTGSDMEAVYEEYVAKYGKDNADYLMEVMGAWTQHYNRAVYIRTQEVTFPDLSDQVRDVADRRGWNFVELAGSLILIRDLLNGAWDQKRFLTVPPGYVIEPSNDNGIINQRPG
jgi:hypothetical protein